ncbi:hypothetical protein [Desulfovulcanus sp.]
MRAKIIFLFLLFLFASVQLASGFFPDIAEVNDRWLKNLSSLNAFQVVTTYDLEEKLSVRLWQKEDLWREEWTVQIDGQNRVVWAGLGRGQEVILSYPQLKIKPRPALSIWQKDLDWWIKKGVDTEFLSYQFLEDQPCLVIGDKSPQTRENNLMLPLTESSALNLAPSTQIWLDNNWMFPVRMVFGYGGDNFIFTWLKYHQIGNFWLPGKLSIAYQAKNWTGTLEWKGININLPDELFSAQAFKDRFEKLNSPAYAISSEILMLMQVLARAHETINIEHAIANP